MATKSFQVLGKIGVDDTIEVSKTEPTSEHAQVWINPDEDTTFNIPEVNDETVSPEDTWSSQKINQELEAKAGIKMEVVDALPATGDPKTMYLVPNGLTGANRYDEYMFVNGEPELLPPRIYELTEAEIDEICTDVADGTGSIPIATKSTIGCVAVGDGLDVDENGMVSLTPTGEVDYIVGRGTYAESEKSIWSWVKYASGEIIVENIWSNVTFAASNAYGSAYYNEYTRSVPSEVPLLVNSMRSATIDFIGGFGLWQGNVNNINPSTNTIKYYAWMPLSQSIVKTVLYTFKGKWK